MRTIQMKCDRCNATLFLEKKEGFTSLKCPYCGGTMQLLIDSDRVRIEEIRADTDRYGMELNYKKHRDHLAMEWFMQNTKVLATVFFVLVAIVLIASNAIRNKDRIQVPFSSRNLNGKYCQDVKNMLLDAGFSDIETIAREDLWDGFLHNDQGNIGKVAQVTINGDEEFRENDSYHKEAKIRIWYHTYPAS